MVKWRAIEDIVKTIPIISAADSRVKSEFIISTRVSVHLVLQSKTSFQHSLLMKNSLPPVNKFHFSVQLSVYTLLFGDHLFLHL